jgi:hypothetical protein
LPPNKPLEPTPLRGPKIAGILQSGIVLTLVAIYTAAAAEPWPLGVSKRDKRSDDTPEDVTNIVVKGRP